MPRTGQGGKKPLGFAIQCVSNEGFTSTGVKPAQWEVCPHIMVASKTTDMLRPLSLSMLSLALHFCVGKCPVRNEVGGTLRAPQYKSLGRVADKGKPTELRGKQTIIQDCNY